jgi:hypothetical protein
MPRLTVSRPQGFKKPMQMTQATVSLNFALQIIAN